MMLAKFSCSPIATQISSVTTMATSRGTSVRRDIGPAAQGHEKDERDRRQRPQQPAKTL